MMSFGINLAVRIYLIGVLFGGWLDRRFGGGNGYITIVMVVFTIFFSIYMLYRDLLRLEKAQTKEKDVEGHGDKQ
ncbi:MAG: AtpZ/AtpI family protein [Clostridia bacterium]|jgi:MFS-type transporter involved in bile tolerance (Atg22 family)|nr:AtpZ/AtpI family protein [Clostridia bacterium]MDD4571429.1 AtpZ/AtpI family protein [Clostridia bacterium]